MTKFITWMDRRSRWTRFVIGSCIVLLLMGAVTQLDWIYQVRNKPSIDVRQYGADPTGAADSTSAIQSAMTAAASSGYDVHIPAGSYLVSGSGNCLLTMTAAFKLSGASMVRSKLLVKSNVPNTSNILCVAGVGGQIQGAILEDFGIYPQSGTPGQHGIYLDSTNYVISNLDIDRVYVGQLGGNAIYSNNPASNIDGFFTSQIRHNVLYGGINLVYAGDSLVIDHNTISGVGPGVQFQSAFVLGVPSNRPKGPRISANNITSNGCSIYIVTATAALIEHNNIEQPNTTTCSTNAVISLVGDQANSYPVEKAIIQGNNYIAGGNNTIKDNLRVDYATRTTVKDSVMPPLSYTPAGVIFRITSNATYTDIENVDIQSGALPSTWLDDQGQYTKMEYRQTYGSFGLVEYYAGIYGKVCFASGRCAYSSTATSPLTDDGVGTAQFNGPISLGSTSFLYPLGAGNGFEVRNGTNTQSMRIYRSYTDSSNYTGAAFGANIGSDGNGFYLRTIKSGTGVTDPWFFGTGGNTNWTLTTAGNWEPIADNSFNVASAQHRTARQFSYTFNQPITTPASSSATCTVGDSAWDTGFIYICTATNTWKRVALSSF